MVIYLKNKDFNFKKTDLFFCLVFMKSNHFILEIIGRCEAGTDGKSHS